MDELDTLDRRIMYELDLNARIPASQLAKKLRKSKETINFRINRLLSNHYINNFYSIFNTSKLDWFYHKIYVKFKDTTPAKEKEILEYVQQQPHVAYLASTEGYYDCVFLVMVRNFSDVADFLYPLMKLYGAYFQEKETVTFLTTHRLTQRFMYPGEERKNMYYPIKLENYKLDDIDKKLLKLLSTNARLPLTEIANKISIDPKVVKYRMKKLEQDKIILGYVSSPNFGKLGLEFIQINISLKDPAVKNSMIEYFDSTYKCLFAIESIGKYDLIIEVHIKNHDELRGIVDSFKERFAGKFNDYDISSITKEYVMVWGPFV